MAIQRPQFDKYFSPARLSATITKFAEACPEYCRVHVIGTSDQGRPIQLLEISDLSNDPETKPAFYLDSATHPDEIVGVAATVHLAWTLLDQACAGEASIIDLLTRATFHLVPMLNPDGVEVSLKRGYRWISNGRYTPDEEQPGPGFYLADVDGDGCITEMRIPDPNGEWKVSEHDDRLMVIREPDEQGGQYYRILPEGFVRDWDGASIDLHRPQEINLNRGYPLYWTAPRLQLGASPYPVSEPENRAVVEWFLSHPNICVYA
jgi:murein tripeptide amidase MpaA